MTDFKDYRFIEMSLSEINETIVKWLNPVTSQGKEWCANKLSKITNDDQRLSILSEKAKVFSKISKDTKLESELLHIASIEPEMKYFLKDENNKSELERESTNELIFLGENFQVLNFVPWLLAIWSAARIYIFPAIYMIIPLLVFVLPYFILRFMMKLPLTIDHYLAVLKKIIGGISGTGGALVGESLGNGLIGIISLSATLIQIVVQAYWTFKHLYSINSILESKAKSLLKFMASYENITRHLENYGIKIMRPHWPVSMEVGDWRQIIAWATLYPVYLRLHLQAIAEIDCWLAIGKKIAQRQACPVTWKYRPSSTKININLKGIFDPACLPEIRKPFDFSVGNAGQPYSHYLLTGPNRGGKSTALRSLASCMVLAHSFGTSLGTQSIMTPIDSLSVCLRPDDLPGQKSRFEREVDFAWGCLRKRGRQFVLIDELFHSTNPSDAEEASILFTGELWNKRGTVSIISTHLFNFVENAPDSVGRLCCPATIVGADTVRAQQQQPQQHEPQQPAIQFSYEVKPGICKVSSVRYLIDLAIHLR